MMETCSSNFIKYVLFLFNLIFAISGLGLIIAGGVVYANVGEFSHFMEGRILAPPIVLIVAGSIIFIIAFLGCYGAIKESYYLLIAFALCLLLILIVELAVGIAAAVFKNDFETVMKDTLKSSMDKYLSNKADRMAWDHIQTELECCGIERADDWPKGQRPYSCCHALNPDDTPPDFNQCQNAQNVDPILYSTGCLEKLKMKTSSNASILIGVGIGIAFIEVIGIVLACWLATAIKKKE
ncbi:CD63 antigen-like [Onthophagus taurus]|uniref:CD63 antigen-like n=1 Tax=Onthophagus taurus TaxID=166361 RepID=UPI0039BE190B